MKFSPLLLLAIPLATAHILQDRQVAPPTPDEVGDVFRQADPTNAADCLTLCSVAALADSSNNPRCAGDDAACKCKDEGWTNSLTSCISRVCAQNIVGDIFDAIKVACKRAQAPLKSDPSYDGGVSNAEESASALSSAISAASSVIVHTTVPTTTTPGMPGATDASSAWSAPPETETTKTTNPTSTALVSVTVSATGAPSSAAATTSGAGTTAAVGNTSGAPMVRAGEMGVVMALLSGMLVL